ncbi:MAG: hypothetical protein MJ252_26255 [archaeon]|nr:hypothetical protein [archaeon]
MQVQTNRAQIQTNSQFYKNILVPPHSKNSYAGYQTNRVFGKDITNVENLQIENVQKIFNKKKTEANSMEPGIKLAGKARLDISKIMDVKKENKEGDFKKEHQMPFGSKNISKKAKFICHNQKKPQILNQTITEIGFHPKTFRESLPKEEIQIEKKKSVDVPSSKTLPTVSSLDEVPQPEETKTIKEENPLILEQSEESPKNPQDVDEYFPEIEEEYFANEKNFRPDPNYMSSKQKDISNHMRSILNDWLIDVHLKYKFQHETIFLAVNILDRYLSQINIHRNVLQLVGVSALMIAAKYEEIYPPDLKEYSYITDNAYTNQQVKYMESEILKVLEFNVTITSPLKFLEIFRRHIEFGQSAFLYAEFLMDLSLLDIKMQKYLPSELAAAALWMGLKVCEENEAINQLKEFSRCQEAKIKECSADLIHLISKYEKSSLKAVMKKYSMVKFGCVSKIKIDGKF